MRQYPLYSKTAPPAILAEHFTPEVFEKSQKYGKHKAKFSIFSGLYTQFIDTLQLASGMYHPWAWMTSGRLIGLAGFGPEYQVRRQELGVVDDCLIPLPRRSPSQLYSSFS
jgi:STE24 endopeptidase